jgi:hypothetical protein
MKKVSILFDKKLQRLLATDAEFKKILTFRHALAITSFVVEVAATGVCRQPNFPVLNGDFEVPETIRLTPSELALLTRAYKSAGRIEVWIVPGAVEVCLALDITFYGQGKGTPKLLEIFAGVDSMAVRKFGINLPATEPFKSLFSKGRQEREERNATETRTRSLAHIGP